MTATSIPQARKGFGGEASRNLACERGMGGREEVPGTPLTKPISSPRVCRQCPHLELDQGSGERPLLTVPPAPQSPVPTSRARPRHSKGSPSSVPSPRSPCRWISWIPTARLYTGFWENRWGPACENPEYLEAPQGQSEFWIQSRCELRCRASSCRWLRISGTR